MKKWHACFYLTACKFVTSINQISYDLGLEHNGCSKLINNGTTLTIVNRFQNIVPCDRKLQSRTGFDLGLVIFGSQQGGFGFHKLVIRNCIELNLRSKHHYHHTPLVDQIFFFDLLIFCAMKNQTSEKTILVAVLSCFK